MVKKKFLEIVQACVKTFLLLKEKFFKLDFKKRVIIIFAAAAVLTAVIAGIILASRREPPPDAREMLSFGEQYLLDLDFEQALVQFLGVIEIDPRNESAYLSATEAYLHLDRRDEAIMLLEAGIEETGSTTLANILAGVEMSATDGFIAIAEAWRAAGNDTRAEELLTRAYNATGDEEIGRLLGLIEYENEEEEEEEEEPPPPEPYVPQDIYVPSGRGTADSPIMLATPHHLEWIAVSANASSREGRHFLLANDIIAPPNLNLDGRYPPLEVFDGGGFTITVDVESPPVTAVGGLFFRIPEGAVVRNLTVSGNVRGFNASGLAVINEGLIENVTFIGEVSSDHSSDTGGIVGANRETGVIRNCVNHGSISGESFVGGIAGVNDGIITDCENTGNISGTDNVDGVIGHNRGTARNNRSSGGVTTD